MKLLREFQDFNYDRALLEQSKKEGRFLMRGIISVASKLNQNGRIYPLGILQTSVLNYQKLIRENRAYGECCDEKTEIKTEQGWKSLKEISNNERILTLNTKTNEIEIQTINKKIILDFNGEMFHFYNNNIDMMLTPKHNMLLYHNKEPFEIFSENLDNISSGIENCFLKQENGETQFKNYNLKKIPYNGKVYCVNVANRTWLMKRNGKTAWSFNCDHPDSSVINLANVSHIIREMNIDDKGVVSGVFEIFDSPSKGGLLREIISKGGVLSVSTRGIGTTTEKDGVDIVNDDYSLIGVDVVADPSCAQSQLIKENKNISKEEYNKIFNQSDRINKILNDILIIR